MAGGRDGVGRGLAAERAGIARDDLRRAAAAEPERLGTLLLEADAGLGAGDLEVQVVLAAGRDLGDHQRAVGAECGAEDGGDRVLGGHGAAGAVRRLAGPDPRRRGRAAVGALAEDGRGLGAERADPLARDELDEVAPVRADVSKRTRRAALGGVDAPVVVLRGGQPVLQVAAGDEADRARASRSARGRAPRARPGGSGRRTGRWRRGRSCAAARDERVGLARRRSPAASRRSRACLPRAPAPRAARASRWASRCGRRRRRRRSTSASALSYARSAPRRSAASRDRSGDDVATPASRAPASRADRACTAPMKPAPTMPARGGACWCRECAA